ncbi:hypothetical protein Leryth_012253 [Lithospermum erythrorhizon]|nr:hypothetical protein Leryth_012253 [Lithospermum erythrorhizon]
MARSYSYSPSPSRCYRGRYRSPSPKGRYGGRERDPPTSLLVRNLRRDTRTEDLRGPFGEFGPLKDVYLPRDYYTGVIRRSPPRHGRSYSRSPRYARTYSRSPDYYLPSPYSRSVSPRGRKYRERSYSSSPYGSRSRSRSPIPEQSRSPSRSDGEY